MMRTLWSVLICSSCLLQLALQAPLNYGSPKRHHEFTYPSLVDSVGNHLSYDISHHRHRQSMQDGPHTYFKIEAFGHSIILNVSLYTDFFRSEGDWPTVEYIQADGTTRFVQSPAYQDCHHLGHVQTVKDLRTGAKVATGNMDQWASISTCRGLHGVIATESGHIFIEPSRSNDVSDTDGPTRHKVYKTTPTQVGETGHCMAKDKPEHLDTPPVSEPLPLNRLKRSGLMSEITIETAVVADKGMLQEHGRENLESYLFTLMGVVHHLYKDSSIGHSVTVSLVRVIILEDEPKGFSSSSNGYRILNNFCSWQRSFRESSPRPHFDVAVLVTGRDICESSSLNCGKLGLADVGSVCDPGRSCNVNKDTGLSTAFTIAHELGHNLGLRHDGDPQTLCSSNSRYLMAPTFAESINPHMWSPCSRKQLTDKLSQQTSVSCLLNKPASVLYEFSGSPILHGMEYTPTEQCRLQAGNNVTEHCPGMADECKFLWCRPSLGSKCTHQHSPAAPGTACTLTSGGEGVCYQGACQEYSSVIEPRDGGWGEWAEWSPCSLTCGMGVQHSDRECDSPIPANGGQWCPGSRRRYRVCNTQSCPGSALNFRDTMCQNNPPDSQLSHWRSATLALIEYRGLTMCHSQCTTDSAPNLIYNIMTHLPDGAPCLSAHSKGVCVQGTCEPVGCDGVLGEASTVDQCGVWCGRGDSCVRVSTVFNNISLHGNYYYYQAGCIPAGSANIVVEEITPTQSNYIIIDGEKSKIESFNFYVRRDGLSTFFLADSSWTYGRLSDSSEYYSTQGPINERVLLYVLANSRYTGIRYTFSLPRSKVGELCDSVHYWRVEEWGVCEGECGLGERRREVNCVRLAANKSEEVIVNSSLCDPASKPEPSEACYIVPCVYGWSVGGWGECDAVCGVGGQTRNVTCEWTKTNGEKVTVNDTLCGANKPVSVRNCTKPDCVYSWSVSEWDSCDVQYCGDGRQRRNVTCDWERGGGVTQTVSNHLCSDRPQPSSKRDCRVECVYEWRVSTWAGCEGLCGEGDQRRLVDCVWVKTSTLSAKVNESHCDHTPKPHPSQKCPLSDCRYVWRVEEWGVCDVPCGEGWKTRKVSCLWEDLRASGQFSMESEVVVGDEMCSPMPKPETKTSCVVSSCPTTPTCQDQWPYCGPMPLAFCVSEPFRTWCCKCT